MGWKGFSRASIDAIGLDTLGTGATHRITPAWPRLRRSLLSRQALVFAITLAALWLLCLQLSLFSSWGAPLGFISIPELRNGPKRMTPAYNIVPPLAAPVACFGPRGRLLSESPDDDILEEEFSIRTWETRPSFSCG